MRFKKDRKYAQDASGILIDFTDPKYGSCSPPILQSGGEFCCAVVACAN